MNYLLDTSAVSALMRSEARMEEWLSSVRPDDNIYTCAITRGEVLVGIERLDAGRRRTELEDKAKRLLSVIPCEAIPAAAGDRCARVNREQQRRGLPLDENDLWIAATALALGTTLVTGDSDFQSIQELSLVRP